MMAATRRHTLLLSTLLLALSACGGGTAVECAQSYWDGEVGTCLPSGWHVLDRANLDDRGVPEEAVVAFQTDESIAGQYLTVVVTREDLPEEVSSSDYSEAGAASVTTLPGYARLDEDVVQIDGEDHILHSFTAQPSDDQPVARFYQLSLAKGRAGYTFTAATPVSIDDSAEERITAILKNATLNAPSDDETAADDDEASTDE
jgi:hypothetical protein